MKNVAITGINGFIGGVVAQHFLDHHYTVKGCGSQQSPVNADQNIDFIQGRFQDEAVAARLLENTDTLIHCAGMIHLYYGLNEEVYQVNCKDTIALAEQAIENQVQHFIYISSIHAFEEGLEEVTLEAPFEKDHQVAYNFSKASAVEQLRELFESTQTRLTIIYPTAVLGIHNYTGTSMMKLLDLADQMPVLVLPNAYFDVVDVDDVAESLVNIVNETTEGEYIIGGHRTSMKKIAGTYLNQKSNKKMIFTVPVTLLIHVAHIFEVLRIKSEFSLYNMKTLKYGTETSVKHQTEKILDRSPTDIEKIIAKIIAWKSH